ncbi:hypothetical protein MIB92_19350, partial [Aestuariirhabdus sp. Z084]|uniref:hypothetical protein n=1 Tax=Aestuariirhabdus haliotis TaxID=2918751 RepID=UPI00201B3F4F
EWIWLNNRHRKQRNAGCRYRFSGYRFSTASLSTEMDKEPLLNLDGYLHALRRLSGNRCDFWVEVFDLKDDVVGDFKNHLSDREVTLSDELVIDYKGLDKVLQENVLSKLAVKDESLLKLFGWDIVEYIQMSYRLIEPEIDPVSSNEVKVISAESEFHGRYIYVFIPVKNKCMAVGLATRT